MQDEGRERDEVAEDTDDGPSLLERVELPDHASAYYSPVPPPAVTQHQTIETEAVRVDPALVPDAADTQRIPTHQLPSTDRDAPTVRLRTVSRPSEPRSRRRIVWMSAAGLALGASAVILWRPTPPDAPLPARSALPAAPVDRQHSPAATMAAVEAPPAAIARSASTPSAAPAVASPTRTARAEPVRRTPERPSRTASLQPPQAAPAAATPSASAERVTDSPRSWLKTEAPKAWLK